MTRVELVVPWRSDRYRERVWDFLKPRWRWPVTEAPGPEPWCKAASVMPAVEASSAEVVAVVDADVSCDGLADAVQAVQDGAAWAKPHLNVLRLSQDATERVLAGESMVGQDLCQRPYPGVPGGGIVVAPRVVLLDCPLDPRFVGWGQEDLAWGYALRTLYGNPWRGEADLYHCWHPPQERMDRKRGNPQSVALELRYRKARFDPGLMRTLIEEGKAFAQSASEPALHAA